MIRLKALDDVSAVGRKVLGVTFPNFCAVLGGAFAATEIEEAWLKLPILRRTKESARGSTNNRGSGRWRSDNGWGGGWRG